MLIVRLHEKFALDKYYRLVGHTAENRRGITSFSSYEL